MSSPSADLTSALRAARKAKGLSQRDLSGLVDLPQGHISKIESGSVDLRVSSLIELARALDLELTLVPRRSLPAVQSVVRATEQSGHPRSSSARTKLKEFARLEGRLAALTRLFPDNIELAQMGRLARDLANLPLTDKDRQALDDAHAILLRVRGTSNLEPLQRALAQLQQLRSEIAHDRLKAPASQQVRPAYALEDDENG